MVCLFLLLYMEYLRLPVEEKTPITPSSLKHYVGTYSFEEDEDQHVCLIRLENEHLSVDGMLQVFY